MLQFQMKGVNIMSIVITIIGLIALALLMYYVYILMQGDSQK